MNDKVKELVERTRLTDEEMRPYVQCLEEEAVWDIKGLLDAQVCKAYSNPDLALIDREKEIDIPLCVFTSEEARAVGFSKRSFSEAGWRKVIPLAEALRR